MLQFRTHGDPGFTLRGHHFLSRFSALNALLGPAFTHEYKKVKIMCTTFHFSSSFCGVNGVYVNFKMHKIMYTKKACSPS